MVWEWGGEREEEGGGCEKREEEEKNRGGGSDRRNGTKCMRLDEQCMPQYAISQKCVIRIS